MSANMESVYRDFVRCRHQIWEGRKAGLPQPWTNNLVLSGKKFTNVFRILDPGTQFVCQLMDEADDARHAAFLAHLYRHTGVEEAWRFWQDWRGRWPHYGDSLERLLEPFRAHRDMGGRLFTSAYNVFPQTTKKGSEKILSIVAMSKAFWENERPDSGASRFLAEESLQGRVEALQQPGVGAFMSMQIATDFGYSRWVYEDLENDWVLAGPGARAGIARMERPKGETPEQTIRWAQGRLWEWEHCPTIPLPNGLERAPSLMDVQNTFCEFGKYLRALAPVPRLDDLYTPKTNVLGHGGFHYVPPTWW